MSFSINENLNFSFFKGYYKDVWKKIIPPGLTEAEVDFIEEIGELNPGSYVLDIMCGYGRHSLELGRRGYNVTAVDNLDEYIKEIEEKILAENLSVNCLEADVTKLKLKDKFDLVICMGNSFSFFDIETASQLLINISSYLKQNGRLIINTWMIAEIVIRHFKEKEWSYVEDYKYLIDNNYLLKPSRIESNHIIISPSNEIEVIKGIDYIFSFKELESMLSKASFKILDIFYTPRKKLYKFGDNKAYVVAQKSN